MISGENREFTTIRCATGEDGPTLYAGYRGEEFVDVDTLDGWAERLKVKRSTAQFYASPAYHRRAEGGRRLALYRLEEGGE